MNEIEKLILRQIGEDVSNPDVFTENNIAQIRDSINDCVEEISAIKGSYTQQFTIPLVSNKNFYRVSFETGYFGWVIDAWLVSIKRRLYQSDRFKLDYIDPRWLMRSGSPESYMQIGSDVIGIYPKPSSSSDVIECKCVVLPKGYTTDIDRIKVRNEWKYAIVHYAVSEFYASRGSASEANMHFSRYTDSVGLLHNYFLSPERKLQLQANKDPWPTDGERKPWV